jgi:hypothetical protein
VVNARVTAVTCLSCSPEVGYCGYMDNIAGQSMCRGGKAPVTAVTPPAVTASFACGGEAVTASRGCYRSNFGGNGSAPRLTSDVIDVTAVTDFWGVRQCGSAMPAGA